MLRYRSAVRYRALETSLCVGLRAKIDKMSQPSPEEQPCAPARAVGWRFAAVNFHRGGLILLFLLEALDFYSQLADRITPYYPIYHDQVGYMVQTYRLLDDFQTQGWPALFAP